MIVILVYIAGFHRKKYNVAGFNVNSLGKKLSYHLFKIFLCEMVTIFYRQAPMYMINFLLLRDKFFNLRAVNEFIVRFTTNFREKISCKIYGCAHI